MPALAIQTGGLLQMPEVPGGAEDSGLDCGNIAPTACVSSGLTVKTLQGFLSCFGQAARALKRMTRCRRLLKNFSGDCTLWEVSSGFVFLFLCFSYMGFFFFIVL